MANPSREDAYQGMEDRAKTSDRGTRRNDIFYNIVETTKTAVLWGELWFLFLIHFVYSEQGSVKNSFIYGAFTGVPRLTFQGVSRRQTDQQECEATW